MLIALYADIHGNRQAFEACMADARGRNVGQTVLLGDYVGYGADPEWVVERVQELVAAGAIAVVGNHDRGVSDTAVSMNQAAAAAIAWTRNQLGAEARRFLDQLPLSVEDAGRLYVHASPQAPERWHYVVDSEIARHGLDATHAAMAFCGHVHVPAVYGLSTTEKLTSFLPVAGVPVPMLRQRRWLAVMGSVGQPRDGRAAACYGLFDTARSELTYVRVPYDVEEAARRIRAAGLPESLASRLALGR